MASGLERVAIRINYAKIKNREALKKGLLEAGKVLLELSQELVPVDTGALKASARVEDKTTNEARPKVVVSYSMDYAVPVHENLEVFHPTGQSKFLEEPARTHRKALLHIISEAVRNSK